MTTPRIYVACLASYNNGVLFGRWIDATTDVDAMQAEISAILRASPYPNVTLTDWEATARSGGWSEGGYADGDNGESWEGWFRSDDSEEGGEARVDTARAAVERDGLKLIQYASAEEWAIHDHEGLGGDLHEYAGLAEVARRVGVVEIAEDRDIPAGVLLAYAQDYMTGEWGADDLESSVDDNYDGSAETWKEFTEETFTETGGMEGVPERLQYYIDFEAMARDWELGGDWSAYRDGEFGTLYFFRTR